MHAETAYVRSISRSGDGLRLCLLHALGPPLMDACVPQMLVLLSVATRFVSLATMPEVLVGIT